MAQEKLDSTTDKVLAPQLIDRGDEELSNEELTLSDEAFPNSQSFQLRQSNYPRTQVVASSFPNADAHIQDGFEHLERILFAPDYESAFVETQAETLERGIQAVIDSVERRQIRPLIKKLVDAERYAAVKSSGRLHPDREEHRRLRRALAEEAKKGPVRARALEIEDKGELRTFDIYNDRRALQQFFIDRIPPLQKKMRALGRKLDGRRDEARAALERVRDEWLDSNDPSGLREALSMWGRTPDQKGSIGPQGFGFHGGVIHYFAYRANAEKNGRFLKDDLERFGVQGFIDFTMAQARYLLSPSLQDAAGLKFSAIVEDDQGQERRLFHTGREFCVAFRRIEDDHPRLLTIIPYPFTRSHSELFTRKVQRELEVAQEGFKLNELGSSRTLKHFSV